MTIQQWQQQATRTNKNYNLIEQKMAKCPAQWKGADLVICKISRGMELQRRGV